MHLREKNARPQQVESDCRVSLNINFGVSDNDFSAGDSRMTQYALRGLRALAIASGGAKAIDDREIAALSNCTEPLTT